MLALLRTPLAGLLHAAATGTLAQQPPLELERRRRGHGGRRRRRTTRAPRGPATWSPAPAGEGVLHAGTRRRDDGAVVSAGGRVLSVVGTGADLAAARDDAYAAGGRSGSSARHHRTDIALRAAEGKVTVPSAG